MKEDEEEDKEEKNQHLSSNFEQRVLLVIRDSPSAPLHFHLLDFHSRITIIRPESLKSRISSGFVPSEFARWSGDFALNERVPAFYAPLRACSVEAMIGNSRAR